MFVYGFIAANRRTIQPKGSGQLRGPDGIGGTKNALGKPDAVAVIFRTRKDRTRCVEKGDFALATKNSDVRVDRSGTFGKQRHGWLKHGHFSTYLLRFNLRVKMARVKRIQHVKGSMSGDLKL